MRSNRDPLRDAPCGDSSRKSPPPHEHLDAMTAAIEPYSRLSDVTPSFLRHFCSPSVVRNTREWYVKRSWKIQTFDHRSGRIRGPPAGYNVRRWKIPCPSRCCIDDVGTCHCLRPGTLHGRRDRVSRTVLYSAMYVKHSGARLPYPRALPHPCDLIDPQWMPRDVAANSSQLTTSVFLALALPRIIKGASFLLVDCSNFITRTTCGFLWLWKRRMTLCRVQY
ncbi:hypothetical protein EI94DRAFT_914071 [Lactarius quietus]|nr:hypothetical protein EI94DRAFT_914071 [Lactarius quietus]